MAVAVSAEQQADAFVRSPHRLLIDGDCAAATAAWRALGPAPAVADA